MTALDLPGLAAYLTERHTHDLFRLETLGHYRAASDDEDFDRYLAGEPEPAAEAKRPWLERLRDDTAAGRRWRRVHIVTQPLSDYLRYECEWGYTFNVDAGEAVRILDAERVPAGTGILAGAGDFFVVDYAHAVQMTYDERGTFVHATPVGNDLVDCYRAVADACWRLSVPFTTWWSEHPQYHRNAADAMNG